MEVVVEQVTNGAVKLAGVYVLIAIPDKLADMPRAVKERVCV